MPTYSPTELDAVVQARMATLSSKELLSERIHKRLLEMWCASRFALGYAQHFGPCRIEIEDVDEQRDFDFHQLLGDDRRLPFQITEVKDKNWARGWEYKNLSLGEIERRQQENGAMSEDTALCRFREQLLSKANDKYANAKSLSILLYANIHVFGIRWEKIQVHLNDLAEQFSSVWVITENLITCIFGDELTNGEPGWRPILDDA
mgnify:FL=1